MSRALDAGDVPWQAHAGRWRHWRDRLLVDPAFQRLATHFPLTRWIARRRARALFDLAAGFVYSQVLHTCVRVGLFERLAAGPQALAALAAHMEMPPAGAARLLDAAVALELCEPRGPGVYGLGALGAAMVANPGIGALVEHHAALYADLADPLSLFRQRADHPGRLQAYWPYSANGRPEQLQGEQVGRYSALMSLSQPLVAEQVLDAYPLARRRSVLDIGGGEGAFVSALARRSPRVRLTLFDLPAVAARARRSLAQTGLDQRVEVVGGDFRRDALMPSGAAPDAITLVRVLHDHDDEVALELLRRARDVLAPGGVLLIAEPMAGVRGAQRVGDAYFGVYLLAMGQGRPRTAQRIGELLRLAGFSSVRRVATRMPLQVCVVVAR